MNIAAAIGTRTAISTSMPANIARPIAVGRSCAHGARADPAAAPRRRSACKLHVTPRALPGSARPRRSAPGPARAARRSTTSAAPRIIVVSPASCTATRTDRRAPRQQRAPSPPAAARRSRRAGAACARAAFWVKKSTMMFAPCSWHHGRHSEMHTRDAELRELDVARDRPRGSARSAMLTHRHQRHDAGARARRASRTATRRG